MPRGGYSVSKVLLYLLNGSRAHFPLEIFPRPLVPGLVSLSWFLGVRLFFGFGFWGRASWRCGVEAPAPPSHTGMPAGRGSLAAHLLQRGIPATHRQYIPLSISISPRIVKKINAYDVDISQSRFKSSGWLVNDRMQIENHPIVMGFSFQPPPSPPPGATVLLGRAIIIVYLYNSV